MRMSDTSVDDFFTVTFLMVHPGSVAFRYYSALSRILLSVAFEILVVDLERSLFSRSWFYYGDSMMLISFIPG